jgi:uncharacterized protein YkwD
MVYLLNSKAHNTGFLTNITTIVPIKGDVVEKVSLAKYINNPEEYEGQHLTILGYLTKTDAEYLTDDSGNKIKLLALRPPQKALFPVDTKTIEVYGARGILNEEATGLAMQVRSLDKVEEETEEPPRPAPANLSPEISQENRTDYIALIKTKLKEWKEVVYEAKETETVKQAYPEIGGIKLPASCWANGDSEECKCPADYVRKWNSCVQVCKDNTIYDQCSTNKPYLCQEGRLIESAQECGCPWRYERDGNTCVDFDRAVEKRIFYYTNQERKAYGVHELQWDDKLSAIAREHSEDMVANNYFAHTNLQGEDPSDRARRHGYSIMKSYGAGYRVGIAENIGTMPTGNVIGMGYVSSDADSIAEAHVKSWMSSPGHRANILDSSYSRIGVGVDYDSPYYIATQDFW